MQRKVNVNVRMYWHSLLHKNIHIGLSLVVIIKTMKENAEGKRDKNIWCIFVVSALRQVCLTAKKTVNKPNWINKFEISSRGIGLSSHIIGKSIAIDYQCVLATGYKRRAQR